MAHTMYNGVLCLQVTSTPPLLDVPTYSLATLDKESNETGMNILTYATPVSIKPDRIWCIGLYKGTVAHKNFMDNGEGVLQLLAPEHATLVKLLGGSSGRDVDKEEECEKLGFKWITTDGIEQKLLPGCICYLKLKLASSDGQLIDFGSHDAALCVVESIFIENDIQEDKDTNSEPKYLNSAMLRELGIINPQGRVAE